MFDPPDFSGAARGDVPHLDHQVALCVRMFPYTTASLPTIHACTSAQALTSISSRTSRVPKPRHRTDSARRHSLITALKRGPRQGALSLRFDKREQSSWTSLQK